MTRRRLTLGFSPCPNDTFMFDALVHGRTALDADLAFELHDIEALNERAVAGRASFDVTKLSLPALARCRDRYAVLGSGAALGRGVGPLVVARDDFAGLDALAGRSVAIPGELTTAFLLFRIFGPAECAVVAMRFDRILDAVAAGEVEAGLVIHESRFTFAAHGLRLVADLGEMWEQDTGLPLPLGVIAARRELGIAGEVEAALRASIEQAFADPAASWAFVRANSQEMDEAVCRQHIALYVNEFSVELGAEGRAAIDEMLRRASVAGLD